MNAGSWSIHEAVAVSYQAFVEHFGADLLWRAFDALTSKRDATLAKQGQLDYGLGKYLQYPLSKDGDELTSWMKAARADSEQADLLLHIGVRWWLSRDDLLSRPAHSRVPCEYAPGSTYPARIQLLTQMLYRGRASETT